MYHIGGIPGRRQFFFGKISHAKSFTGRISQYFFKIPKGGVRRVLAASKLLGGITNFDPKIFFGDRNVKTCSMFRYFGPPKIFSGRNL